MRTREGKTMMSKTAALATGLCATGLLISAAGTAQAENVLTFARTPDSYVTTTGRVSTVGFTVELWFRQTTQFDAENQLFMQDNNGNGRIFLYTRNGKPYFQVSGNGITGSTSLTLGTWYHFAAVRDAAGYGSIYINGQIVAGPTVLNTDVPAGVGANTTLGLLLRSKANFRGDISDVRLWNTVRSLPDILAGMTRRLTGTEPGLAHYWPLDDGAGSIVADRAGNAPGIITGATWSQRFDLPIATPSASDRPWISPVSGDWSASGNWLSGNPAQGAGITALFTNNPPAALAVSNDIPGLTLGNLTVHGAAPHTFTGAAIAFTNNSSPSFIMATNGLHTLDLPAAVSPFGLVASTLFPAGLTFAQPVSGPGGLTFNPAASGGGTVTLTATNTYTGPTVLGAGTVSVPSLDMFGPGPLTLGPGTLRLTGPAATSARGLTFNAGSRRAAVLSIDNDLTITGTLTNAAGAFIKRGPGTLTYASPATSRLGIQMANNVADQKPYPANGDSPTNGFGCFTVTEGKVILGAHPAQTNYFNEEVTVGAYTTDQPNAETSAELEFVGGYHRFGNYLDIGYYNGTTVTAPTPLTSAVTVSGGTVSAYNLIMAFGYDYFGANNYPNGKAVLNIAGGTFTVDNEIRFGDQRGDPNNPMHATLNVTSGAFIHTHASNGMTMGWRSPAANGTLNVFGGLVDEYANITMAANGSTSRFNLHGGTVRFNNITHNGGTSHLFLNGGTLQPRPRAASAARTLSGITSALVSTNGAVFDTSLSSYIIAQNLLHDPALGAAPDGGLTKLGTNTLTITSTGSTYTGPTVIRAGELRFGGSATQAFAVATLAIASNATLSVAFKPDGTSNDRLTLAAAPAFEEGSLIALCRADDLALPFAVNGTYTLMSYPLGADPDVSGLACANPAPGKAYTFAAANGAVTVTVSNSPGHIWDVDDGGYWSGTDNWTTPPAPGDAVRFDDVITGPRTVIVDGEATGDITFNNANAYTLAGSGLSLASGASVNVERGAHTVAAPLTLADSASVAVTPGTALTLGAVSGTALTASGGGALALTAAPTLDLLTLDIPALSLQSAMTITPPVTLQRAVTVTPATGTTATLAGAVSGTGGLTKAGSSTLVPTAANTYTGPTTINAGTLAVSALANGGAASTIGASPAAAANLVIGPATFRYTGPSATVNRGLTFAAPNTSAAIIRIEAGADLAFSGPVNSTSGAFVKTGPGTLRFTAPNTLNKLNGVSGTLDNSLLNISANGDGPTQGMYGMSITEGKLVLGAPGQTNSFGVARLAVGVQTTTAAGAETAGELEFIDGFMNLGNGLIAVGRNNGNTTTAPGGVSSRLTMRGGIITNANHISLGYATGYNNYVSRPAMEMSGGTIAINNFFVSESSGSRSTVAITGGVFRCFQEVRVAMAANTEADFTLGGNALFEMASENSLALGSGDAATALATLRLDGGTLRTRNIAKAANAQATLRFNGGTFQPRASSAAQTLTGLTAALVSTNGAVFDTALTSYTVAQNLLHDPALGADPDGGLTKASANTLSLTGAGNTFNGPVDVRGGLLRARLGGVNDLAVAPGAAFDALGGRCTVRDLTGQGLLTNGTMAVTGTLDPGTNAAPAGATMTIENLALTGGSTLACTWATNGLGQATNDFVTVTGELSAEGRGFFDLGREDGDPIPVPLRLTAATYGTFAGSFTGWKVKNTGLPIQKTVFTVVTTENGIVTVEVKYGGTVLLIR